MSDFGNRHTLDRNRYEGLRPLVRSGSGVYISTAEGRVLQTGSSIDINTGKVLKDFRYEYYLKDHLGNVRFLFTDTGKSHTSVASTGVCSGIVEKKCHGDKNTEI